MLAGVPGNPPGEKGPRYSPQEVFGTMDEESTIPFPAEGMVRGVGDPSTRLLPDVWGEGMLFAYSGMEGQTGWNDDLVGSTMGGCAGFHFHEPIAVSLSLGMKRGRRWLRGPIDDEEARLEARIVGSDLADLLLGFPDGSEVRIRFAVRDRRTLWGEMQVESGDDLLPGVLLETAGGRRLDARGRAVRVGSDPAVFLAADRPLRNEGGWYSAPFDADGKLRFALGIGERPEVPDAAAFRETFRARAEFLFRVPPPPECTPDEERTYYKCVSVAKVNSMSSQPGFDFNWTTPDRYPHAHLWNWDSAFHALGLRHVDPRWAVDSILAVLALQRQDGWIPHWARPDGRRSDLANPALLAWAAWNVYETHPDRDLLERVLPTVGAYVVHNMCGSRPGHPALGWQSSRNETGMDNSPRFDGDVDELLCVDMNCYAVNEAEHLALIARELEQEPIRREWQEYHREWSEFVRETFWHEEDRFFYDRRPDGSWVRVPTAAGLMPLFAGVATAEQAEAVVERIADESDFWRPFPVSTVSARSGRFVPDMWRGPTWANTNYLVAIGLERYGRRDLARRLRESTLREIVRWYRRTGVIWEYYDCEATRPPNELYRKGKIGGDWIHSVVRDYHFTAAILIDLLRTRPWWG